MNVPKHSLSGPVGLTDDNWIEPTHAVQYAVVDPGGSPLAYGDQSWVAYGTCIRDGSHPDGKIQRRTITISYGEWEDA